MTQPTVFISYSHLDEREKDQLLTHLGIFQSHGLIGLWSDDRISAGGAWEADIEQAMSEAKVAILLVSANFLNSNFILSRELPRILQRRRDEGLIVFPVIAKPCAWQNITWLAKMNVRPKNGTPVWRQGGAYADEELAKIATEVYKLAKKSDSDLAPVAPGADLDQYMTPAISPRPAAPPQADRQGNIGGVNLNNISGGAVTIGNISSNVSAGGDIIGRDKIQTSPASSGASPSTPSAKALSLQQKMSLVEALLEVGSVKDRATRDSIIEELPSYLKNNIRRHPADRTDVINIVSTCINYSDGLQSFIEIIALYEGNSIPMQKVKELVG